MQRPSTSLDRAAICDALTEKRRLCFLGIGGIGMSALAEWCYRSGIPVYGHDRAHSENTARLSCLGIPVTVGDGFSFAPDTALAVTTAALSEKDPLLAAVNEVAIPLVSRADLLSAVASFYENVIAVAGTHGKSTTTAILSAILSAANAEPTVLCGAVMPETNSPLLYGDRRFLVIEACEYRRSFLALSPTAAVVLSTERDHPDTYADDGATLAAYRDFLHLPTVKIAVTRSDVGDGFLFASEAAGADLYATDVAYERGCASFIPVLFGRKAPRVTLRVAGKHNLENACAAYLTAYLHGISVDAIAKGLSAYRGIARRMEYVGKCKGAYIYTDYAHHPTEIRAAIDCARKMTSGKVIVVFEAHTYSRTKAFYPAFLSALSMADHLFVPDIFAARETDTLGMSGKRMARDAGGVYIADARAAKAAIMPLLSEDDLVLFMGAGNFFHVSREFPLDGEGEHLL